MCCAALNEPPTLPTFSKREQHAERRLLRRPTQRGTMEEMNGTIDIPRHLSVLRGAISVPFFTWLGTVIAFMLVYTLTASAPMLGEVVWQDSARFATGWWMTSLGGHTDIAGTTLSLMPLTITLLMIYASYQVFRSKRLRTWGEVATAVASQTLLVALIGAVVRPEGTWWYAIVGATFAALIAALFSVRESLLFNLPWWRYVERAVWQLRWVLRILALLVLAVVILAAVTGWSRIADIHGYYLTDIGGSIGLVVTQLMYLPVFVIWALTWLLGPGFAVGAGTNFSALGVTSAPLPAIPVLGMLPDVGSRVPWVLAIVAAVFLVLGLISTRRSSDVSLKFALRDAAVAGVAVALIVAVLAALATGSIGPDRMVETGPEPAKIFGMALLLIVLPLLVGTLAAHRETIVRVTGGVEGLRDKGQTWKAERDERLSKVSDDDDTAADTTFDDDGAPSARDSADTSISPEPMPDVDTASNTRISPDTTPDVDTADNAHKAPRPSAPQSSAPSPVSAAIQGSSPDRSLDAESETGTPDLNLTQDKPEDSAEKPPTASSPRKIPEGESPAGETRNG